MEFAGHKGDYMLLLSVQFCQVCSIGYRQFTVFVLLGAHSGENTHLID